MFNRPPTHEIPDSPVWLVAAAGWIMRSSNVSGDGYKCVYLHAFETGSELRVGLTRWIGYYNTTRCLQDRPLMRLMGRTKCDRWQGSPFQREHYNWRHDRNPELV
jgi:hypothetical protein